MSQINTVIKEKLTSRYNKKFYDGFFTQFFLNLFDIKVKRSSLSLALKWCCSKIFHFLDSGARKN
jgi:hypothetical protein